MNIGHAGLNKGDVTDSPQESFLQTEEGLFTGPHPSNQIKEVLREGDDAPGGSGEIASISSVNMNSDGQIAFSTDLHDTGSGNQTAIYFYDENLGLTEVVRTGDKLPDDGSPNPLEKVTFFGLINDRGKVAFTFEVPTDFNSVLSGMATFVPKAYNRVANGQFSGQLTGWNASGGGTASIVQFDNESVVQLEAGSPVALKQQVDSPDSPFEIAFDFRFVDNDGSIEVLFNGKTVHTLDAATFGAMNEMQQATTTLDQPSQTALTDVPLEFQYINAMSGSQVQLDDVSLRAIPEPDTGLLLLLGGFAGLGRGRRRR